jgi:glyoxylase-like metal-dependent hydrolase (beta-lactamase superfamily II)
MVIANTIIVLFSKQSKKASGFSMCPLSNEPSQTLKLPRNVLDNIFAFPPNRDTLGGTAYLIVRNVGNILIDSPPYHETNLDFLKSKLGVRFLVITHRGAIGKAVQWQQALGCEIIIQEQEAYLLPEVKVTTFEQQFFLQPDCQLIWTPGHSPGSSCLYYNEFGGVLFTGRHLIPNKEYHPIPLRTSKTFHWKRQINSLSSLVDKFTPHTLQYICPGASIGHLRGKHFIDKAYEHLVNLDIQKLMKTQVIL